MYFFNINFLRTLAIIFIVLFHFNSDYVPNGYLGVEIFLVISGFLLFRSYQEKGAPAAHKFIEKKVVRLYPPLLTVLFISSLLGLFFVYDDGELLLMFRTMVYTMVGCANIFLSRGGGYFSPDAAHNPLMHCWYICVILQIFLLYITIAASVGRWSKAAGLIIFILLGALSLIYSIVGWAQICPAFISPQSLYYSSFARFWEVAMGIAAIHISRIYLSEKVKGVLVLLALVLICALALYPTPLPMYATAPGVVCGTLIVIAFGSEQKIFQSPYTKPLAWIGTISFSLYLVHYPLIVFFKNWDEWDLSLLNTLICGLSILLVAICLYKLIETRRFGFISTSAMFICVLGYTLLFRYENTLQLYIQNLIVPYPAYVGSVEPAAQKYQDFDSDAMTYSAGTLYMLGRNDPPHLVYTLGEPETTPCFVVLGDSNAEHLFAGMDTICKEEGCSGIHLCSIMFPFWERESPTASGSSYDCGDKKMKSFLHWLSAHEELKTVIIAQYWKSRFNGEWKFKDLHGNDATGEVPCTEALRNFCRQIRSLGREVILVAPAPSLKYTYSFAEIKILAHKRLRTIQGRNFDYQAFTQTADDYDITNKDILRILESLEQDGECKLLRTRDAIFKDGADFCAIDEGTNEQYMRDATHMSPTGSVLLLRRLKPEIMQMLRAPRHGN